MKYLISNRQLLILEQEGGFLNPKQILLFKKLNQARKKIRKRNELFDYMERVSDYFSIPKDQRRYNFEIYMANFRSDGNYEQISKEDFVDPRYLKPRFTPNADAGDFVHNLLPFKGSNLTGGWKRDLKGVKYYKIESYGWYPIYIFKNDKWYEVSTRYSSATGRQMSNTNPKSFDDDIKRQVYWATPDEMKMLERVWTHDDFMKSKLKTIETKGPESISKRKRSYKSYGIEENDYGAYKIKFKITDVKREGDRGKVYIDVYDVFSERLQGPIDYLKGERGINKEIIEQRIIGKIGREMEDFIGGTLKWWGDNYDPNEHILDFVFNHIRNKELDKKTEKENGQK